MVDTVKDHFAVLFEDYQTWKTHQQFYCGNTDTVDIDTFLNLPCFLHTDVASINQCNSPVVVINNLTESVNSFYRKDKFNDGTYYVVISSGGWNTDYHENLDIKNYDNVRTDYFLSEMSDTYFSPHRFCFYLDKTYDFDKPKQFLFCSTTGNRRIERDTIVNQLLATVSHDNCIIKYHGEDLKKPSTELDVVKTSKQNFDAYSPLLEKYYHTLSQTLPMDMYNSCYFNFVVEFLLDYNHAFHITEKTIKCLITGMPFVIISTPGYYQELHKLGFQTYNSLWDESYDSVENYVDRVKGAVDLVESLKTFDWNKNKNKLKRIADHNLRNMTKLDKLTTRVYNDLEHVVQKATQLV